MLLCDSSHAWCCSHIYEHPSYDMIGVISFQPLTRILKILRHFLRVCMWSRHRSGVITKLKHNYSIAWSKSFVMWRFSSFWFIFTACITCLMLPIHREYPPLFFQRPAWRENTLEQKGIPAPHEEVIARETELYRTKENKRHCHGYLFQWNILF